MSSPHPGYGPASPRGSAFSFEHGGGYADSFEDVTSMFSEVNVNGRSGSRAASSGISSSASSNANKVYVYYRFTRGESSWGDGRRHEINCSQDDLKKLAKSTSKQGKSADQLRVMGKSRYDQIEKLRSYLDDHEVDGSIWEPVFIENKKTKRNGKEMVVTEFDIIFARRSERPTQPQRRESKAAGKTATKPAAGPAPAGIPLPNPIIADANKGAKRAENDHILKSPFNTTPLFDPQGMPLDAHGPMPFAPAMPPNVPAERPMFQSLPKMAPPQVPAQPPVDKPQGKILDEVDILFGEHEHDDIVVIDDGLRPPSRPGPGPRRQSSAQRSTGSRYENVIIENRHPDFYTSNRSSWASEDGSIVVGEWDEVSSKASNDSHHSHPRSPNRKYFGEVRHNRQPSGTRYHGHDTLAVQERQRRPTPTHEQALTRRNSQKPTIHQTNPPRRPSSREIVPPLAPEPPSPRQEHYGGDRYRDAERHIQEQQRRELEPREQELTLRQAQIMREHQRLNEQARHHQAPRNNVEVNTGRKGYNYNPRDMF